MNTPRLITSTVLTIALLSPTRVFAQQQEAATTQAPTNEIQEEIKERIQKVKTQVGDRIKGTSESDRTTFGIIGSIEKIVGSTLQVKSYQGTLRVVDLVSLPTIIKASKPVTKEDIELDTPVLLMGSIGSSGEYIGKRIVIAEKAVSIPAQETTLGTMTSLTSKALTLTTLQGTSRVIPLTTKTQYLDQLGTIKKRTDISENAKLVVVFQAPSSASSSALRVHLLP